MNQTNPKLWTKNFIILSSVNFIMTLIFFLLNATITLYAINEFDASTGQAGIVAGIFIIGSLLGRLFTGRLIHSKKILMTSLFFLILTTLLYFVHLNVNFLILNRLLNGITVGIISTIVSTVVVFSLPAPRKGEGISYFAISTALATGIGPFIGLVLSQNSNFEMIFSLSLLLGIFSLVIAFFLKFPATYKTEKNNKKGIKISDFVEPKVMPIAIIIFFMTFCFSGIVSYLNIYALELGLIDTASFFFMVYTVFVLISRPFTGRIMDKKGANIIIYPALIIYGVGMLLLSSVNSSFTLLLVGALVALGFGNISSITQAIAINLAEPHRVGLATATFFIFYDLGNGFGPSIIGLIIPATGYSGLYVILGLIVLATLFLYYMLYGKKEGKIQNQVVN
ncbi:putative MFS family arabinose efflux permease [Paenibacillus polymyxa]|uniref:MFS transporter n=1 Tax=Paenibacillus polymyxa TaxID=1406 RepID=UPI002791894A|nr:MFS transporter [Paenibacillus polymyxa]MDQ0049511.1 putative MFS family arabinose efflux permease [Paenibacillus polymyxa]